jgi:hypothetical protein
VRDNGFDVTLFPRSLAHLREDEAQSRT